MLDMSGGMGSGRYRNCVHRKRPVRQGVFCDLGCPGAPAAPGERGQSNQVI